MDFEVLILGSDANAYYMARCCHEAYNKKAFILAVKEMPYTKYSNIINIIYDNTIWTEKGFLNALKSFAKKHPKKKILLVSSNETYASFISKNKNIIDKRYYYNYPSIKIMNSLMYKDIFYKTYQNSELDFPKTLYYDCSKKDKIIDNFTYPIIIKPCNVIEYNHLSFPNKNKIYKLNNHNELKEVINQIVKGGYKSNLIIQEYIPGDDSFLFDAVVYCNKNKKVELISFAQIGLQEHTKSMVGNAAVLINGYNTYGKNKEMIDKIKSFMEKIGYQGFAEFDMKYDYRDNKYKVLEINARQGRCSYYISPLGYNLVKILVDDLIYNKTKKFKIIDEEILLSFVPKKVVKNYILNSNFKDKALSLWQKRINPLKYNKDHNLKRKLLLIKRKYDYLKEYKNGYWDNK